jgi:hypothetical protein
MASAAVSKVPEVDMDSALAVIDELMDSGKATAAPVAEKKKKPKKHPSGGGYDVFTSAKSAAEGRADSRVDSLERMLTKIGEADTAADLVSVTVHYVKPLGGVIAVQATRPPNQSAIKLMARTAKSPAALRVPKQVLAGTFLMRKSAGVKKPEKKKEKKAAEKPEVARIKANLQKLQKKQPKKQQ